MVKHKLHNYWLCALALALSLGQPGCGCSTPKVKRPYAAPKAADLVSALEKRNEKAVSFRAQSVMDYWLGDDRVKGKVLVMGKRGAYVRFNALNPTGGNVAVDLACNGYDFKYLNISENCFLTGPCSRDAIAQLLRINLDPDDFLLLAVGMTPLIEHTTTKVSWDAKNAREVLTLTNKEGAVQTVYLDGREHRWDVLESKLESKDGKLQWKLRNGSYREIAADDGTKFRVPKDTRFVQPPEKADLKVRWNKHEINLELDDAKFDVVIQEGVRRCGS